MIAAFDSRLRSPTERRSSRRARDDFAVVAHDGPSAAPARCVELSADGMLLERGRAMRSSDERMLLDLELRLPERLHPLTAKARPVWWSGTQQAFKIVDMSDVDRLSYAEHLDLVMRREGAGMVNT